MATPQKTTAPAGKRPDYFVDQKKGEVNELKALLRNQSVERDPRRKREVIKKVIAYMTLGFDVSRLFSEMVLASSTSDIVTKKMCYLFLSNFAQSNEELATLCINTMTKDCQDSDPLVRGLALRSLSSLRLASTLEYLLPVMSKGFEDSSAYVRRNAVMAVLKLNDIDKELVRESGLVDTLKKKLYDRDAQVTASALMVLNEVSLDEGGFNLGKDLLVHLLNRIKEFSEWGQCVVLALVAKYAPESEEETFGIMNVLDDCLRVANSAVVLATTKCFLRYADALINIKSQIYLRIKQPMLTLMASSNYELRYSVLKHVDIVVNRCPGIFDDQFQQFYCHYNEPSHVKFVKLCILPELTNEQNVHELVQELSEYVNDVQPEISRRAIESFGRIAIKLPGGVDGVLNQLLNFMAMDLDHVRTQVVVVIKDLLRKFPNRAEDVLPALPRCLRSLDDSVGKAAVLFMLGEFGHDLRQTPYLLESVIQNYDEDMSVEVKNALLTAVMKLFFTRAPEMHGMLTELLTVMVNDTSDSNLHDRALLYYRLLRHDVEEAKRCVTCIKDPVRTFEEERLGGLQDKLFEEFNTLSVMYDQPASQFIDECNMDSGYVPFHIESVRTPSLEQTTSASPAQLDHTIHTNKTVGDSDPLGDLLGLGGSEDAVASSSGKQPWALMKNVTVDQATFQTQWEASPPSAHLDLTLGTLPESDVIEKLAAENCIYCMASGDLGTAFKFYFFGRDNSTVLHLAEVEIDKTSKHLIAAIKSTDSADSATFADSLMASLGSLL